MSGADRFKAVVAVHVLLHRENSVLLLRRAHTGYEDGNYSVPAGHLEGGETVTDAAIREAAEEIGVTLSADHLSFALVMHRRAEAERIDFFLAATAWSGQPWNAEPEKCDELCWANLDGLPANVIPYVRSAIAAFRNGERFLEFGWEKS